MIENNFIFILFANYYFSFVLQEFSYYVVQEGKKQEEEEEGKKGKVTKVKR